MTPQPFSPPEPHPFGMDPAPPEDYMDRQAVQQAIENTRTRLQSVRLVGRRLTTHLERVDALCAASRGDG